MKAAASALTALLALLLTASVPTPVEACCRPQARTCCPANACPCHMSSPITPMPASEAPATVPATADATLPVHDAVLDWPTEPIASANAILAGVNAGHTPLYSLTHAFLI